MHAILTALTLFLLTYLLPSFPKMGQTA